ncbi:uncharacterized protein LOC111789613 [Cucurbita pepo subsp. pepo]|uniref:uncharacterized protein LOC111789613 n=1 Tax=Cucurbita pepo subsp. pepo TaxID=3664 RepID=UPI000C9D581C|nr:uncharacterized protein LOC111789613 [Cucurbita pepo subsp. pepo]
MAQKHLHELLKEDQHPFLLANFIADRRSLLKRPSPKSLFQLNRPKPISDSSDFHRNFCRSACFFSFTHSPDLITSSPLFEFQSPVKTPCRNHNGIFLHVPATTAGLLLEAALRIQKQSTAAKSRSLGKSNGLGFLGSFLKRLTHRGRIRKREICSDGRKNGDRGSPPLPANENENENDSVSRQSNLCHSPFRFVLQSSPSPGHRTPEFSSPTSSPARRNHQVKDAESLKKFAVEDEEEEKEQSSPVSVLDPPFEEYDEGHYEDDYNLDRSYAIVQKAKHQLLKKLRRFERLAELDVVELETFLLKDEDEDELNDDANIAHLDDDESHDIIEHNNGSSRFQIPRKRLIYNLVTKDERDVVVIEKRVLVRSKLWKGVDTNAIDVITRQDLKGEVDGWSRNGEQRGEIAIEIELAIFSLLVEEMQTELHCLAH